MKPKNITTSPKMTESYEIRLKFMLQRHSLCTNVNITRILGDERIFLHATLYISCIYISVVGGGRVVRLLNALETYDKNLTLNMTEKKE